MASVGVSSIPMSGAPDFYYRENDRGKSQRLKKRAHRCLRDAEADTKDQRECREDKSRRITPHFADSSLPSFAWVIRVCQEGRNRLRRSYYVRCFLCSLYRHDWQLGTCVRCDLYRVACGGLVRSWLRIFEQRTFFSCDA